MGLAISTDERRLPGGGLLRAFGVIVLFLAVFATGIGGFNAGAATTVDCHGVAVSTADDPGDTAGIPGGECTFDSYCSVWGVVQAAPVFDRDVTAAWSPEPVRRRPGRTASPLFHPPKPLV